MPRRTKRMAKQPLRSLAVADKGGDASNKRAEEKAPKSIMKINNYKNSGNCTDLKLIEKDRLSLMHAVTHINALERKMLQHKVIILVTTLCLFGFMYLSCIGYYSWAEDMELINRLMKQVNENNQEMEFMKENIQSLKMELQERELETLLLEKTYQRMKENYRELGARLTEIVNRVQEEMILEDDFEASTYVD